MAENGNDVTMDEILGAKEAAALREALELVTESEMEFPSPSSRVALIVRMKLPRTSKPQRLTLLRMWSGFTILQGCRVGRGGSLEGVTLKEAAEIITMLARGADPKKCVPVNVRQRAGERRVNKHGRRRR